MKALSVVKHGISQLEHFDTDVYGNYGDYCKEYDPSIFTDKFVIDLSYYSIDFREAIKRLEKAEAIPTDISTITDSCAYVCPYTEYTHYAIIPVVILTNKPEIYINAAREYLRNAVGDKEWNTPDFDVANVDELKKAYLSQIDTILLGSGYTLGTLASDGMSTTEPMVLELSNGDNILCFCKVWYNK